MDRSLITPIDLVGGDRAIIWTNFFRCAFLGLLARICISAQIDWTLGQVGELIEEIARGIDSIHYCIEGEHLEPAHPQNLINQVFSPLLQLVSLQLQVVFWTILAILWRCIIILICVTWICNLLISCGFFILNRACVCFEIGVVVGKFWLIFWSTFNKLPFWVRLISALRIYHFLPISLIHQFFF